MTTALTAPAVSATDRLRALLRADAAFCAALGLAAAVPTAAVADLLGSDVSPALVRVVGVALVLYALDLAVTSVLADRWQRPVAAVAAAGNAAWVLATVGLVLAGALSTGGAVAALLVAAVAAELGVLQLRALRS